MIWATGKLEGEEREKGTEEISETRTGNFPQINLSYQVANQEALSSTNAKNITTRHIILKLSKIKENEKIPK